MHLWDKVPAILNLLCLFNRDACAQVFRFELHCFICSSSCDEYLVMLNVVLLLWVVQLEVVKSFLLLLTTYVNCVSYLHVNTSLPLL
jgi:hypothetical protein